MSLETILRKAKEFLLGPKQTADHTSRRYLLQDTGAVVGAAVLSASVGCGLLRDVNPPHPQTKINDQISEYANDLYQKVMTYLANHAEEYPHLALQRSFVLNQGLREPNIQLYVYLPHEMSDEELLKNASSLVGVELQVLHKKSYESGFFRAMRDNERIFKPMVYVYGNGEYKCNLGLDCAELQLRFLESLLNQPIRVRITHRNSNYFY